MSDLPTNFTWAVRLPKAADAIRNYARFSLIRGLGSISVSFSPAAHLRTVR